MVTKVNSVRSYTAGALWRCDIDNVWWGSQVGRKPKTDFLRVAQSANADFLRWEDYRGWKSNGNAEVCPECGRKMAAPVLVYKR